MHAVAVAVKIKLDPVTALVAAGPDKIRDKSISKSPCENHVDINRSRRSLSILVSHLQHYQASQWTGMSRSPDG